MHYFFNIYCDKNICKSLNVCKTNSVKLGPRRLKWSDLKSSLISKNEIICTCVISCQTNADSCSKGREVKFQWVCVAFYIVYLCWSLCWFQAELATTTAEFESYKVRVHNVLKQQKSKTTAQSDGDAGKIERWEQHLQENNNCELLSLWCGCDLHVRYI